MHETIKGMVFGTRVLKYWVLGPSGCVAEYEKLMLPRPTLESLAAKFLAATAPFPKAPK